MAMLHYHGKPFILQGLPILIVDLNVYHPCWLSLVPCHRCGYSLSMYTQVQYFHRIHVLHMHIHIPELITSNYIFYTTVVYKKRFFRATQNHSRKQTTQHSKVVISSFRWLPWSLTQCSAGKQHVIAMMTDITVVSISNGKENPHLQTPL